MSSEKEPLFKLLKKPKRPHMGRRLWSTIHKAEKDTCHSSHLSKAQWIRRKDAILHGYYNNHQRCANKRSRKSTRGVYTIDDGVTIMTTYLDDRETLSDAKKAKRLRRKETHYVLKRGIVKGRFFNPFNEVPNTTGWLCLWHRGICKVYSKTRSMALRVMRVGY